MNNSKNLTCIITGKSVTISGDYLDKKIEEFGNEQVLENLYICKEVKSLLKKGYNIIDIRKILNVSEEEDLPTKEIITALEADYQKSPFKTNDATSSIASLTSFTYNKSDLDVEYFINNLILKL